MQLDVERGEPAEGDDAGLCSGRCQMDGCSSMVIDAVLVGVGHVEVDG